MSQESVGPSTAAAEVAEVQIVESGSSPMTDEYRELIIGILKDNWHAEAANASLRYHDVCCPLHLAPTMEDRAELAVYWADECRHAVIFGTMLRDYGQEPPPEAYESDRPVEVLRLPITTWMEQGLFELFADSAGGVHLADYAESSYLPLRNAALEIAKDEARHIALAMKTIRAALTMPGGREKAHEVLATWYHAAMKLFGHVDRPSRRAQRAVALGIRRQDNAALLRQYKANIDSRLTKLGLAVPS